jgi:Amt family ammonium transporter
VEGEVVRVRIVPGDVAWVLCSTALVMFMTPGLALFYGGLVRTKNVLGTMAQSFVALAIVSVTWVVAGYTLAFGPDHARLLGGLDHAWFAGVGATPVALAPTIPSSAFAAFQLMFAVITPALITGAVAERMRFGGYVAFLTLWSVVVYAPVAHWVWGGGFLGAGGVGALDFAGGTVVHVSAGAAALAAIRYLGPRRGHPSRPFVPHNVPMVLLGAGILWFGWFGFNAGSALSAGGTASTAFVNTQLGAAAGALAWLLPERLRHGRASTIGAVTGAVAGLVAITPAAGFVSPAAGLAIGAAAGVACFAAVELKQRLRMDDSLDVVGVHLVGGVVGALLTGALASLAVNAAGADGSLLQVARQAVAVAVTLAFSFAGTTALLVLVDRTVGLRLSADDEERGLDLSQHAEAAYTFAERPMWRATTDGFDPEAELARLRESIVTEAARRAIAALEEPSPLD